MLDAHGYGLAAAISVLPTRDDPRSIYPGPGSGSNWLRMRTETPKYLRKGLVPGAAGLQKQGFRPAGPGLWD